LNVINFIVKVFNNRHNELNFTHKKYKNEKQWGIKTKLVKIDGKEIRSIIEKIIIENLLLATGLKFTMWHALIK